MEVAARAGEGADCTMTTVEAREHLSDVINKAAFGKERVLLTRRGRPVAAVVPVEDLDLLARIEDEEDVADARAALAEAEERGTIPWEQVKTRLGL